MFQDIWTTKLPWAKVVMVPNGKLSMVNCKVCSSVEKKHKLLVPKFDDLQKHVGQQRAIVAKPNVKVGKYFMSLNIQHAKNEQQFATMHVRGFVIDQVNVSLHIEKKQKFLQFVIVFHLL